MGYNKAVQLEAHGPHLACEGLKCGLQTPAWPQLPLLLLWLGWQAESLGQGTMAGGALVSCLPEWW